MVNTMLCYSVALLSSTTLLSTTNAFLQSTSSFARGGAPISTLTSGGSAIPSSASRATAARPAVTTVTGAGDHAEGMVMSSGAAKKIVVLGGDGFCGWPTCLHLSDAGYVFSCVRQILKARVL